MTTIAMILTSHGTLGSTGRSTGWYLPEAAHPWAQFCQAGFDVVFVSPTGGRPPIDGVDASDPVQRQFLEYFGAEGPETRTAETLDPATIDAVFYVGGHGAMWDLPSDGAIADLTSTVARHDGVVAAVCHGPAGLVPVRGPEGRPLVAGRRFAGFTNDEEAAVGLTDVVPFLLADRLGELGGIHVPGPTFGAQVVVDGRLVTGQNPASATGVAEEVVALLSR